MPLVGAEVKAKFKTAIKAGLARNFGDVSGTAGYGGVSAELWDKIADAISDIGLEMVTQLHENAEVAAGIPTPTGPTTGPGKIL